MTNTVGKKNSVYCTDIKQLFADFLTDALPNEKILKLKEHLITCSGCNNEFEELTSTWSKLGLLPEEEPSADLRKNFYTMLDSYKEENIVEKKVNIIRLLKDLWPKQPVFQFGFAMLFLIIGFFGGYKITFNNNDLNKFELKKLEVQSDQLKQNLSISLLDQSSPSQRIKGLTWSSTVQSPNEKLINSVLNTLNNDPNINVRLSAVEALYLFSDHPKVKTGLVESLQKQTSPLVQVALIDMLVELREKRGIAALKELLKKKKVNPDVKNMAENSIKQLL